MKSILWYDLETWNAGVRSARIAQFAAIRTDLNLTPIEAPILFHCAPAKDCIPDPHAILVHKLLPHTLPKHNTLSELALLKRIRQLMQQPDTIISGYNNLRFDNEVLRFSWFRNALDAYAIDYKEDNRWDIIDTLRACYALRPSGVQWFKNEENITSFKLEHLAMANQLDQKQAHDALSDVSTTINMAKLIQTKQPKLYDFFFKYRDKYKLLELLKLNTHSEYHPTHMPPPMLVHISGMITDAQRRAEIILPIAYHPSHKNEVIAIGLKQNPKEWYKLSVEEIHHRVFAKKDILVADNIERLRIFTLRLKKVPAIAPLNVLQTPSAWQAISHNQAQCQQHYAMALHYFEILRDKLIKLYQYTQEKNTEQEKIDADLTLYQQFLSPRDKRLLSQFQDQVGMIDDTKLNNSNLLPANFDNPHLNQIIFRTRARNFPHTLTQEEQVQWQAHCEYSYLTGSATGYSLGDCHSDLTTLREHGLNHHPLTTEQHKLLTAFEQWLNKHTN